MYAATSVYRNRAAVADAFLRQAEPGFSLAFRRFTRSGYLTPQQNTAGVVFSGRALAQGAGVEPYDAMFMAAGQRYAIEPDGEMQMFTVSGDGIADGRKIVRASGVPVEDSELGGTRKTLKSSDESDLNIHVIWVNDENRKKPHYHRKGSEIYLVHEGRGVALFQDAGKYAGAANYSSAENLRPGSLLVVPRGVIHQTYGDMVITVYGVPRFHAGDVHFVKG